MVSNETWWEYRWSIPDELRSKYRMPWMACVVWSEIASCGFEEVGGWCCSGTMAIAKSLRMSCNAVDTAVAKLKEKGLVEHGPFRQGVIPVRAMVPWVKGGAK